METNTRKKYWWIFWLLFAFVLICFVGWLFLFGPFASRDLTVKGSLKTKTGAIAPGAYDFRLIFYEATTRTRVVHSFDAADVTVTDTGAFAIPMPESDVMDVATLMQVCLRARGTDPAQKNDALPSCAPPDTPKGKGYSQTICGLTTVDAFRASRDSLIYATPTVPCGGTGGQATISDKDVIAPLLENPNGLASLLTGINVQPGTVLTVDDTGTIVGVPVADFTSDDGEAEAPVTNVFNSYPTTVEGEPNTDNQTLSLSGSILSISGGNSVTLPSGGGAEQDGVIGNEFTDVIASSGLVRVGAGTTLDPFQVGLITCASGEVIKSTGAGTWGCNTDTDTDTTYSAGTGISFAGTTINNSGVLSLTLPSGGGLANSGSAQNIALQLQDCGNGEILQFVGGDWTCVVPGGASPYSFSITDNSTTQPITNGNTITFLGNEGLAATVSATDTVTYGIVNGGVTALKLATGSVETAKIADGAVTTITINDGAVTNAKLANSSLTVTAGAGLSGGGVVALGASTTLNLQTCSSGQILKHNGTTWACAADNSDPNTDSQTLSVLANAPDGANTVSYDLSISGGNTISFDDRDTLYTALSGGGLALGGGAFSLQTCPVGQLLKSTNAATPAYSCATDTDTDTNTTYTAGTGLSLVGTTFNNTGVLTVGGSGAITSTGGQNPNIAFADGTVTGQFWQWDGDSWELATLAAEADSVIGNEVTNVTGANSGLVRSGSGTSVSPYTLAVSAGNGLQLTGGSITINSPTCAGTDKLQWNGTAFVCSADVDTDTNTTYTAGSGLSLAGTTFNNTGVLTVGGSGAITSSGGQNPNLAFADGTTTGQFWQWDGDSWELATLAAEADSVIGNEVTNVTGANSGLVRSGSGTSISPYTLAISTGNGLQLTSGNITINSPTCAGTDKLQWNGTAFVCSADVDTDTNTTYTAGTGLSLVGTTFNNTGVLTVAGGGAITSTGGQNPTIAFADGTVTGQFWQWDGDSWELATLAAEADSVIGNEVTDVTGVNSGLVRSGSGTSVSPYTLAISTGNGLQLTSGSITIASPTCAGTDKLQWNGTAFVCAADTDTNTTYTAGTGLSLVGTTFNNTGVLSVAGSGAITSTGGQNPTLAFADGTVTGQFWQWDGDSWELATSAAEVDGVIGNEVTDVTGVNSGLVRSGAGTSVSPYTLAVSVGNGLQLTGGNVTINSPTCAGTDKLQWNGTAFVCSADVDTDTTNFNITDGSTSQSVAATQTITFSGSAATKLNVALSGTRTLTFSIDTAGASTGNVLTFTGSALAWQAPTTYAPTTCSVSGTYFCQGGNTFGTTATLGTTNAQALNLNTNNALRLAISSAGLITIGGGTASPDSTPGVLVLDHKSDAGDPGSPVNGSMYYNDVSGTFRCYQNSAWVNCLGGLNDSVTVEAGCEAGGTTTSTTYVDSLTTAGVCGVAFIAPPSGKVMVHWNATGEHGTAGGYTFSSVGVRAGGTPGSGSVIVAASDTFSGSNRSEAGINGAGNSGGSRLITGLTSGTTYNATTWHKVFNPGTGTFARRAIQVVPAY